MKTVLFLMFVICSPTMPLMAQQAELVKVVLVGDSTTIGGVPREISPDRPHLEKMMEIFAAAEGLPKLEVINTGKGGETAKRLIEGGRYAKTVAPIENVDYVIVRMGINDWYKCKDVENEFPVHMKALIGKLKEDHSDATIIISTVTPFGSVDINGLIKTFAQSEGLMLFDLNKPYRKFLEDNGPYILNVRRIELEKVSAGYHEFLKPHTYFRKGWGGRQDNHYVMANDTSLDPLLGHIKGWYDDKHPNSTGYQLIARETVAFLKPLLQETP